MTRDAASNDEAAVDDLELLLETRGLVRYATFRIRRARRLREQQKQTDSPATPRSPAKRKAKAFGTLNGIPNGHHERNLQSSTMTLDAYDEDTHSSRVTSMSDSHAREEELTEDTAMTEYTNELDEDADREETIVGKTEDSIEERLAEALEIRGLGIKDTREHITEQTTLSSQPEMDSKAVDTAILGKAEEERDPEATDTGLGAMINHLEEEADDFVFELLNTLWHVAQRAIRAINSRTQNVTSTFYDFSSSRLFQGFVLGVLMYRILQVLAVSSQEQKLQSTVIP